MGPLAAAPRERESQFDFLATTGLNCERAPSGRLLGPSAEEPQDNPGGSPIVVLMKINAEGGSVVVDIEQTDLEVSGGVDI